MADGRVPLKEAREGRKTDSTDRFLYELAQKGLLEIKEEEEPKFRSFKSFWLHDLAKELCITKGKEEEFFKTLDNGEESKQDNGEGSKQSYVPRLAIHLNKYKDGAIILNRDRSQVRELLIFEDSQQAKSSWPHELSDLKDFESLRVLRFDGVDFKVRNLPKGFEELAFLRYLSFYGCDLEKLPTRVGNLPFLQTLDLRVRKRMEVPNVLSKMKRLRHLYFPVTCVSEGSKKISLDGLIELEILENFDIRACNTEDLSKLDKLRVLNVIGERAIKEDLDLIMKCMKDNECELQVSFLDLRKFDCFSEERLSFVASLPKRDLLDVVHIEGYIPKLPNECKYSEKLLEILLNGSELKEDPVEILGKLQTLRSRVLKNDAFVGKQMRFSASDFPQLKCLKLLNLHKLENLTLEEGSVPKLSTLAMEKCGKLTMLPEGLKFLKNLEQLKILSMPKEFMDNVQKVYGQEVRDASGGFLRKPTFIFENR